MARVPRFQNGVGVDITRLTARLATYMTNQSIARNRAAWNAHIDARTDAQIITICRVLLKEIVTFEDSAETDPQA